MESACSIQRPSLFDGASFCFSNRLRLCPKGVSSNRFQLGNRSLTMTGRFYFHSTTSLVASGRRQPMRIPFRFRITCQANDDSLGNAETNDQGEENDESESDSLEELRDLLHKAIKDLEVARLNSTMFEEKAQRISETAIALKDEATSAWHEVNKTLDVMRVTVDEESVAKEAVQTATMALSLAEARLRVVLESLEEAAGSNGVPESSQETEKSDCAEEKEEALLAAKDDIRECQVNLADCEAQLTSLQNKKDELQKQVDKLNDLAETIQINALKAEEDVANIMILAEQAVAFELEATQRVNDAEIALQRAEKSLSIPQTPEETQGQLSDDETTLQEEVVLSSNTEDASHQVERESLIHEDIPAVLNTADHVPDKVGQEAQKPTQPSDNDNGKPSVDSSSKVVESDSEKSKIAVQTKKQETQKDLPKEGSSLIAPKASFNKSSRFFSASFFSSSSDGTTTVFASLVNSAKQQWPKLVLGFALLGAGLTLYSNGVGGNNQLLQQSDVVSTSTEDLSVERLSSMKKYVFGLGSAQVLVTAAVVGLIAHYVAGQAGPAAIVIGNGLALSSTAVVLQVLQERGESTSRHGRATFSVLLFQDLAVVVLLILIPLISPNSSKGGIGFQAIAEALGLAAVKAAVAITAIIAGGRLLLRPIYKQIAENRNAEIFSANTLLVILGTSLLTARAGLSMALGAFLAGLLLAETEFSLQVESDIAPYRGLLLGLFFMTVGMSIDPKLLLSNFPVVIGTLGLLIVGKTLLVVIMGKLFGISIISAIRAGLLLAPGGEFAFVAFGEAVNQGIMSPQLSSLLFLVVGISMAITPWLAAGGQLIASRFELHDVRSLLPVESETDDLQDHIIICGFGRVGQIIAQLLSERLIPFVALDVSSDRVTVGRSMDLPVYFGDAGSREVLHKIGAERACAAVIALDAPGANYRCVWALSKYYPNVKTFVRAHDVVHGLNLEKAGATAVVPETLEPSLQLAAAVLAQAKLPTSEIANTINEFRTRHLSELTELCETSGSSLGYGFSRTTRKTKPQASDASDDNQIMEGGTLAI
ncbi:hypothetical protein DY000_02044125 [Brassica cretica]|uniref:RCK N-terminal domain-containing protein n=1 Tax=Brassica cretica TaxID=69181 RepID=A0ABQ7F0W0_BRACR|nr:hypothetical protein DY000_02044125 [Brassica cretica]